MECKTENSKLKTKDSGQRDGKQVNKITKSKMKQNETKLNRKLQLAVGSHRQSNDLQLCANLFASSPRCLLCLPRTRLLLVSAAPSRRTRAHHNSERLTPATASASATATSRRWVPRGGHEGRATFWWRWDLSGITRSLPHRPAPPSHDWLVAVFAFAADLTLMKWLTMPQHRAADTSVAIV